MTEHERKFDELAKKIGIEWIKKQIPATKKEIEIALKDGDEHLNTIPLKKWDSACGFWENYRGKSGWFHKNFQHKSGLPLSCADCVCVMKHVAKFCL